MRLLLVILLLVMTVAPAESALFRRVAADDLPHTGKSFGATWADMDRDGRLDFLLLRHGNGVGVYLVRAGLRLVRQDSCGFVPCRTIDQHGTAACDYDGDGDWDLYATVGADRGQGEGPNELWSPNAKGIHENVLGENDVLADVRGRGRGALWLCLDEDRYPELLVLNFMSRPRLFSFHGQGWHDWSERLQPSRVSGARIKWYAFGTAGDLDGDGRTDLFVSGGSQYLLWNAGQGQLVDVTDDAGLTSRGMGLLQTVAGDVDNDGDLDLLFGPRVTGRLQILMNESSPGKMRFVPGPGLTHLPKIGSLVSFQLADFDNDGFLDLYMVRQGPEQTNVPNLVARGQGNGDFQDMSLAWGGLGEVEALPCGTWPLDLDRDGDLDLMLTHGKEDFPERTGISVLYENTTGNRGLTLELVTTNSSPHGLGARVELHTGTGIRVRQVRGVLHHGSSSVLPLHFGLGDDPGPYGVVVTWPGGAVQEVELPRAGVAYLLVEGAEEARILGAGE
ncbi:MAG: CRTAC1 family protein [bacterium]|nr:CRTAC1 family protein [bacterium]